ncbi:MAG: PAS domain S-box protein, partial [Methanoregulaceae archaeon]|nr:PAS domain S-box protein [Methanoregulaceae archaeon]
MYSVLCVDDEPVLLKIAKKFLEQLPEFEVQTSLSATGGLELLKSRTFDVIVADYQMPDMDGIIFLKTVRKIHGNIPFILFTGRGREDVAIEAINNGANFYLQKGGEPKSQFVELGHKIKAAVDKKRTEDQLDESKQRMADIINFLPDATLAIDKEGSVIAWNRAIEEMTGVPAADMLGKGNYEYAIPFYGERRPILIDLVFKSDDDLTTQYYSIIKKEGDVLIAETSLPRPLGTKKFLLGKASILYDKKGDIAGAIESIRDITERKTIETALGASEQQYRNVVEEQKEFICRFSPNGTHVFVNDAYCRYFNQSRDEIVGGKFSPRIPEADKNLVREHFASLTRDNPVAAVTHRIIMDDGQVRWQRWSDRAIFDETGALVEYQSVGRDFTEQKNIEEALKESETRYRNVVEDQTELVSRFLPDGTHIFANDAYCRYFGIKKEEIIGRKFIPDMPEEDRARMQKFLSSLTVSNPVGTIEHAILLPGGELRWQQWSDRAIFDDAGRVREYQSVGRDVTERKNTEIALEKSRAELQREESRLEALVKFYQMNENSQKDLLIYAIEEGVKMTGSTVGYLAFVSEDESVLTMYAWSESAMKECAISKKPIEYKVAATGLWGEAIRQRKAVVTNDYSAPNPLKKGYPEGHVHISRHMNVPVFDGTNIVLVAGVGNKPSDYNDTDAKELTLLMNGLWNVIRRRRAEEALQKSNRKLHLMNNITRHDILNQLTALHGYIELSVDSIHAPDQMREFIEKEKKIVWIIKEQLSFMRDYQNIGIKAPVWQSVNDTVRRGVLLLPTDGIEILYDSREVEVFADPMFEKVFYNLVQNSLNYGGEKMMMIRISSSETSLSTKIMYEDDGKGISIEDKNNLFELGFGKNTGFGLHLSREILAITGITIIENG